MWSNDSMITQFNDFTKYVRVGIMVISAIALLVVCVLILVLLALAFLDGRATRKYARRQLSSLARERTRLMLDAIVRRTGSSDSVPRKPDKQSSAPEL